jgi:hypothetical protein
MAYHRSLAFLQMIPRRIKYRAFHHYWKLIRYHRGCDGLYRQGEEQKAAVTPHAQKHLGKGSSNRRRSCHRNVTELSQSPWCGFSQPGLQYQERVSIREAGISPARRCST